LIPQAYLRAWSAEAVAAVGSLAGARLTRRLGALLTLPLYALAALAALALLTAVLYMDAHVLILVSAMAICSTHRILRVQYE